MRQWSALHPYNAIHAYRLTGPLNLPRLQQAIADTYSYNGLGLVEIAPDGRTFHYETTADATVEVLDGAAHAESLLADHLAREMNRPFPSARYSPLRFSVVTAGQDAHYLAVTYDHWVADSIAIRLIFRQVLSRYHHLPGADGARPLDAYPATYREAFAPQLRWDRLAAAAARSAYHIRRNRSAVQVPYSSIDQMAVGFGLYATAAGTVDRLKHFARAQDATVHDVILAALSRGLANCLPRRSLRNGGRELVTGTIVDTRGDASLDLSASLGTFLAYYQVRCKPDDHQSLAALTRAIAAITRPIKQRRRYLDSLMNMQVINRLWPRLSAEAKPRFLRRVMPMAGGVSNVRLSDPWFAPCVGGHPLDYVRVAPTGPLVPMVITPTTVDDRLNVGVTYRLTGFSQTKIDGLVQSILEDLQHPDRAGISPRKVAGRNPPGTPLRVAPQASPHSDAPAAA